MATYTDIEIRITVTNGKCSISTGRYQLNSPLHIELSPDALYGIPELTAKTPALKYCYTSSNGVAFSQKFVKSAKADTWELDTSLQYYQAPTTDMYCVISYEFERCYAKFKNNLVRCTTDAPDGYYPFTEQTITVISDAGSEFQVAPKISYYDYDKSSVPWKWQYTDFEFERISESEYKITVTPNKDNTVYTISAEAVAKTDVTDKYGLIAIYKPDKEVLAKLAKIRFATPKLNTATSDSGGVIHFYTPEYIDTAQYAISLRKMYFKIDTTINENICLGPYNTEIQCPVIGTDVITIDMGTVAIVGRHQSIMDYKNTDIQLYLPFVGFIELETSDFMDKSVSVRYEVNVINGDALVVISADGNIMKTVNCNASFPVPYRLNDRENVITTLEPNTNYLLQEKPFLYVKSYNEAVPDAKAPYNDTKFYSKFKDVHGYTQATEIDYEVIHDYITKTEIDEIIHLLESGIFL